MPRIRAASIAEHKVITRAQILETARELFSVWGYRETSFGDIAAEIGIGRTTLYEYFTDKEDLLASLVEETLPPTIGGIVNRIPHDLPPEERLRRLMAGMIEFVVTEPTLGLLLHREVPRLSEAAKQRVAAAHRFLAREFVDAYQAGVAAGDLRRLPPGLAGRFINSLIMSAVQALIDSDDPAAALPAVTGAVTDLLFNGLAAGAEHRKDRDKTFRLLDNRGREESSAAGFRG